MNATFRIFVLCLALLFSFMFRQALMPSALASDAESAPAAPAFTHAKPDDWLNSKPLGWKDLQGQVVLLDFWTFDCWNCYRSIPWLLALEQRNPNLHVISVHTPELPQEYVRDNVVRKVAQFKLTNPVMLDNDYSYWNAMNNHYWPAFYLVDKHGRVRASYAGETHEGDDNARSIEAAIKVLAAES